MNQGFSILELLLSLSFAVVLASITVLNFKGSIHQSAARSEATTIAALIESARIRAINTKSPCEASLELRKFTISCEGNSTPYKSEHFLKNQVTACKTKKLRMWERGTGNGETLCLKNHQKTCQVVVSLRGRTSVTCPQ
jgi:type II secretory pathway pseudopilin PulG